MQRASFSRQFVLVTLALGAVVVFHQPIRHATLVVLRFPFTLVAAGVKLLVNLPRLPALAAENARLRADLMQRHLENAQLREALRHTQQAAALLESVAIPQGLVATVLGRSILPTQQTVLLNKGGHDGVTLESVMVDADGVIGRVIDVHPATSLVMLLTDSESRVASLIERSRETGLLVGRGQGQCELIYLGVDADVQVGDRVVTAGLSGPFPKGLLLGTVVRVVAHEPSSSASAWVTPAARLGRFEDVLCVPRVAPSTE